MKLANAMLLRSLPRLQLRLCYCSVQIFHFIRNFGYAQNVIGNCELEWGYNMMKKTKNVGSPLWFWIGTLTLALIVFISSASIISFVERYSTISEWPIRGMLAVEIPLILFGVYCVRKGKGDMYSLKDDMLPVLIISLLLGLLRLAPLGSPMPFLVFVFFHLIVGAVPVLLFVHLPLYLFHRRALRKMGVANIPKNKRNRKIIELQCSYNEAFNLCVLALNSIGARILEKDESLGIIKAETMRSLVEAIKKGSWGEIITIDLCEVNDRVRIEVMSKCRSQSQIFDYGKNYENVKKIADFLKSKTS